MKGQAKRFVNHRGQGFSLPFRRKAKDEHSEETKPVGFFSLWRYASWKERALTAAAVLSAIVSSCGIAAAVLIYGEVTSLFVARTKMEDPSPSSSTLLTLFGGAATVANGSTLEEHKMALIEDSIAFTLASLAVMAAQFTTASASVGLANYASISMAANLREKLLRAVLNQEIAFFDTNKGADIVTTITESVSLVREGTGPALAQGAFLLGGAGVLAAAAAAAGWRLALAGLALLPPALIVSAVVAHFVSRYARAEGTRGAAAARSVREALQHARTVRTNRAITKEVQRYGGLLASSLRASRGRAMATSLGAGLAALLAYSINALVLALGARLVARDMPLPPDEREYDPGVLVIVLFCTFMSLQQLCLSAPHAERVFVARGAAALVHGVLQRGAARRKGEGPAGAGKGEGPAGADKGLSEITAPTSPQRKITPKGDIVFDDVYFNYPSRPETKVLRGFSLKITAGQCVCLVGGSGSGKSTAMQLLQGLYEPLSGTITVDGTPLHELDITHFRRSIGVVGQEPVLFSGTIRENMTLGAARNDFSQEEIERAARLANAHDFIMKLDKGYDTMLGTRNTLSGGQKQRLCIARAALRHPPLLLLDEPTAALDPHAETQVQEALVAASAGRTTIIITHRLSTIPPDAIVAVIEQGAVREVGLCGQLARDPGSAFRAMLDCEGIQLPGLATVKEESQPVSDVEEQTASPLSRQSTLTRGCRSRVSRRVSSASLSSLRAPAAAAAAFLQAHTEPEEPVPSLEEEEDDNSAPSLSFKQLLLLQWPERWLLAGGGLCAFLVGASMPAFAYLFSELYGLFTLSEPSVIVSQSSVFAGYFLLVAAVAAAAAAAQGWLLADAGRRLTYRLSVDTAANYLRQDSAWLSERSHSVGALCARLATDCPAAQGATGAGLGAALQGVSTLLLGGALAAAYSWKMTAASLVALPLVIGAIWLEGIVSRRSVAATCRAESVAATRAQEAVLNVRTVHALGAREAILSRYSSCVAVSRPRWSASVARGAAFGASVCAPTLGYCAALAVAGRLIATDNMPLHYAILVSEALIYGAWMMSEALAGVPARRVAARAAARVCRDRDLPPAIRDLPLARHDPAWRSTGSLEVRDAWVCAGGVCGEGEGGEGGVSGEGGARLRGVSLRVAGGARVALVGPSGCGKTTLLQLLLREVQPTRGKVLLDGIDISQLSLETLRAQFAYVEQEGAMFSRSMRDNIAYGAREGATMDELTHVATLTGLHGFIAALPQGYETVMSSGGASVSGGQRQRVSVCRALLQRAPVLLLDEPTSALEPHSEQLVTAALSRAECTLVVAAHRLHTVRDAHCIYVMDQGRIVESGCHDDLLEKRGLYHELWTAQHRDDHQHLGTGDQS